MASAQPMPRLAVLSASALKRKLHADVGMAALNLPEPRRPNARRHLSSSLSVSAMRECLKDTSFLTAGPSTPQHSRRPRGGVGVGPPASPRPGGGQGVSGVASCGCLPSYRRGASSQQACLQEGASCHTPGAPIAVPPDDPFTSLADLMEAMDLGSHAGDLMEYSRGAAGPGAVEAGGAGGGPPEGGAEGGAEVRAAEAGPEGAVSCGQRPVGRPALTSSLTHHNSGLYQVPKSRLDSPLTGLFAMCAAAPASSLGTDTAGGVHAQCVVCLDRVPALLLMPCKHRLCPGCSSKVVDLMRDSPLLCPICRGPVSAFSSPL